MQAFKMLVTLFIFLDIDQDKRMTKARELAELGKAVSVHDNRIDFDRQMQVPGLLDSAQVLVISTDSAEVTTIADNQALLNSLIFGGQ